MQFRTVSCGVQLLKCVEIGDVSIQNFITSGKNNITNINGRTQPDNIANTLSEIGPSSASAFINDDIRDIRDLSSCYLIQPITCKP